MTKNFFKDGKWTENTKAPVIKVCDCGAKYIKTREGQKSCLQCASDRVEK